MMVEETKVEETMVEETRVETRVEEKRVGIHCVFRGVGVEGIFIHLDIRPINRKGVSRNSFGDRSRLVGPREKKRSEFVYCYLLLLVVTENKIK
jgi:hypothetical protein